MEAAGRYVAFRVWFIDGHFFANEHHKRGLKRLVMGIVALGAYGVSLMKLGLQALTQGKFDRDGINLLLRCEHTRGPSSKYLLKNMAEMVASVLTRLRTVQNYMRHVTPRRIAIRVIMLVDFFSLDLIAWAMETKQAV